MIKDCLKQYVIAQESTIFEALKKIDMNRKGFLVVTDDAGVFYGVLTDGDIRRGILSGAEKTSLVSEIMSSLTTKIDVHKDFVDVIDLFKDGKIKFIPIVDENNVLVNIITKNQFQTILLQNISADLWFDFMSLDESIIDTEVYPRPWGFYKTTVFNNFYQAKVISIRPHEKISLQMHHHREEHWVVVHGRGKVQIDDSFVYIQTGSNVFLPKGCRHRLTNLDDVENLIISEIQIGDYLGEDDIVRIEDDYGRVLI